MEKLNKENMIKTIKDKMEIEKHNLIKECRKKEDDYRKHHEEITNYEELKDYKRLTDKEKLSNKVIYSNEELDFVINNYSGLFLKHKVIYSNEELNNFINNNSELFLNNDLLANCIYLLNEFKQTKQTSKCNAVYNILNKYFTIENSYCEIYSYPEDDVEWNGFIITDFVNCPTELKQMIKEKVEKIEAEKQKQSRFAYKEKADKIDKEIIAELEL